MAQGYVPASGDLVWLQFDPRAGHEQGGHRPALVISPKEYNGRVGLALLCPITTQAKGYPFEVRLPEDLNITGVVLADQVKSLDWRARQAKKAGVADDDVLDQVLAKLGTLLKR